MEFVLILFPFMIFLFGMIEFGLIFYHFNQMENVARETAREIAVDDDVNPASNGAEVICPGSGGAEGLACQLLSNAARDKVTACYEQRDFPPDRPVFDAVVSVSTPMDQIGIVISVMGLAQDRTLTATATMRVEPGKLNPDENPDLDPALKLCDGSDPDYG
ncbi:MAG: TadE family protein [Pseudomonadota bacterium]